MSAPALDPTWVGACQKCIAGTHGIVKDGRCVCCSEEVADA